jgi:hypothetical protein
MGVPNGTVFCAPARYRTRTPPKRPAGKAQRTLSTPVLVGRLLAQARAVALLGEKGPSRMGNPAMHKSNANQAARHLDRVPYAPTPDSVAAARAAQKRERAAFTRSTGMRIDRSGQPRRSAFRADPRRSQQY